MAVPSAYLHMTGPAAQGETSFFSLLYTFMDDCPTLTCGQGGGHVLQTWLPVATPITRRTEEEGEYPGKEDREGQQDNLIGIQ